jgi:hypothetical protein
MDVIVADDADFKTKVSGKGRLAVVEFSTREKKTSRGTDNASKRMDAVFDEVAKGYGDIAKVGFFRVEIELDAELSDTLNPLTSKTYAINHGPTVVFIKDEMEVSPQLVGHYLADSFKDKVDEALRA